jgi:3-hydroxyisobutyrate dehydrogenase-like beta-hydroxyacid dehydrogenase
MPGAAGAASALKMCYAAYTKGTAALLLAVRALAEAEGVTPTLLAEWDRSQPGLADRSQAAARGTGAKAWRFAGEMHEIADTFAAAGLPDGFHRAAAELYGRLAPLKDAPAPDLDGVLALLLGRGA